MFICIYPSTLFEPNANFIAKATRKNLGHSLNSNSVVKNPEFAKLQEECRKINQEHKYGGVYF